MKKFKIYAAASALMMLFIAQATAQTQRNTINKKTTIVKTVSRRVPSTKVVYRTPTRKVVSVRTIPNRTVIKHHGQEYYYDNNKYYTQSRGRFIVIAPKVGFRVRTLPANYKRIRFNNYDYYTTQGVFYIQINNEYEVVDPEIGTIVYELPSDYEKVTIDGATYYEYANILYEKIQVDGSRAYQVVSIIDVK